MAHYLVVAAMVWDIAYLKRKWLQQQVAGWGWTHLKETPQYVGLLRRDGVGMDAGGESWLSKTRNMLRTPLQRPEHSTSMKVVMKEQKVRAGKGAVVTGAVGPQPHELLISAMPEPSQGVQCQDHTRAGTLISS